MSRSKVLLALVALFVVGAILFGTAFAATVVAVGTNPRLSSMVQGFLDPSSAAVQRVGRQAQVSAPQATAVQAGQPAATPAVAAAVLTAAQTITIQPGADAESQILEAVYQKVNPSVVQITNLARSSSRRSTQSVPQGEGSGFVWDKDGHIVTNDHVVRGADALQVTFADGTTLDATLVGTDANGDIAVIKVDPTQVSLVPVETGAMSDVKVGQIAIAIGNPFGYSGTMTKGIVSALGRTIPATTGFSIPEAIQTDAAINPGNSGGPLLDASGQVIGVNDQIQSSTGSNSGVGFAIPIDIVQRIAPALIKDGKYEHAYLGIEGATYTRAWAQALGLPADARGAYVMTVVQSGPAARAGLRAGTQDTSVLLGTGQTGPVYLQKGGDLIVAVDGHAITKMDELLIYLEQNTSPDQSVKLSVLRANSQQADVTVKLGQRPSQASN